MSLPALAGRPAPLRAEPRTVPARDAEAIALHAVSRAFAGSGGTNQALDAVSATIPSGRITALVGPDGAGKTTLLRIVAGLLRPDQGSAVVLGRDVVREAAAVQASIGYMPQRFGLYGDLSVRENLELHAGLYGIPKERRRSRIERSLAIVGLSGFTERRAEHLSGGMKQKLTLAGLILRPPPLLLLDEPTVGIDPVSRRELWDVIGRLPERYGSTVVLATSDMAEAERCDEVVLIDRGKVLGQQSPAAFRDALVGDVFAVPMRSARQARFLQQRLLGVPGVVDVVIGGNELRIIARPGHDAGLRHLLAEHGIPPPQRLPPRLEDAVVARLLDDRGDGHPPFSPPAGVPAKAPAMAPVAGATQAEGGGAIIRVADLTRRFGAFEAVRDVDFEIRRGEVFGLLGANGAGKSTTFRMLCGLLPPSGGTVDVAGIDMAREPEKARARIGYLAQSFPLYGHLTVAQNLQLVASAHGMPGPAARERIARLLDRFDLAGVAAVECRALTWGLRQRTALVCALVHDPHILFLDELTSGIDPLARREFWGYLNGLAEQGVTIVVSTHLLEEAEYCDRVAILHGGRLLALGTPAEVRAAAGDGETAVSDMEEAFVALVGANAGTGRPVRPIVGIEGDDAAAFPPSSPAPGTAASRPSNIPDLVRKEFRQIRRDASVFAVAFAMPLILLILFGFGVSLNPASVPLTMVVERSDAHTNSFVDALVGSGYFELRFATDMESAQADVLEHRSLGILHVRPEFTRRLLDGRSADIQLVINGVDPNTVRIVCSYIDSAVYNWIAQWRMRRDVPPIAGIAVEPVVWFNRNAESRDYLVPGLIALIMTLTGMLLTALAMAREWERGTLEAIMTTPVTKRDILLGKLLPYFLLGTLSMAMAVATAVFVFSVPMRGSLLNVVAASLLFLVAANAFGLLIANGTRNQFIAALVAIIAGFMPSFLLSGFIFDIATMPGIFQAITYIVPARYFVTLLHTLFLAGDAWSIVLWNAFGLAVIALVLVAANLRRFHKRLM
ncbi:MAG TPA: ATP-binding cassette domain-containing protein [Arenibaculum sp.]|nr:ATP-binding cassette domain-containing protein [Arenibaculum sp.]